MAAGGAWWVIGAALVGWLIGANGRTAWFALVFVCSALVGFVMLPFVVPLKRRRIPPMTALAPIALVLLMLPLAGCSAVATIVGPAPILSPATQLKVAKGEYDFEAICKLAAKGFLAIEPALTPAEKATGKGLAADLYAALVAARDAQALGDAQGLAAKVSAIERLSAQLYTFVAAHTPPAAPAAAAS
jgi:hypothetical protein